MERYLKAYLRFVTAQGLSPHTAARRRRWVERFGVWLSRQGRAFWTASWEDTADFMHETHLAGYSKDSLGQLVVCLRHFYEWGIAAGHTHANPARMIKAPRGRSRLPRDFSPQELGRILAATAGQDPTSIRDRAVIEFPAGTGCRVGELIGADLPDLDLAELRCRITGKGDREGYLWLSPRAAGHLQEYLQHVRPFWAVESRPVFVGRRGRRICQQSIHLICERITRDTGIHVHPHRFRHTLLTQLLARGADLRHVQEIARHENIRNTQRYTHVRPAHLRAVLERAHPVYR